MGNKQHIELLQKNNFDMATTFKQDYVDLLKHYYDVGGMSEVVQAFADNQDFPSAPPTKWHPAFGSFGTTLRRSLPRRIESLSKVYWKKFHLKVSTRTSMADYMREDCLLSLPLWALERLM